MVVIFLGLSIKAIEIHSYLNNQVITITRNTAKADCLEMHARLKKRLEETLLSLPEQICFDL